MESLTSWITLDIQGLDFIQVFPINFFLIMASFFDLSVTNSNKFFTVSRTGFFQWEYLLITIPHTQKINSYILLPIPLLMFFYNIKTINNLHGLFCSNFPQIRLTGLYSQPSGWLKLNFIATNSKECECNWFLNLGSEILILNPALPCCIRKLSNIKDS